MKIQFWGAAREVTGSKHMLKINGKKILRDCGMFQGRRKEAKKKNMEFPFDPKEIDAMILTHAHIDHSGLIPLLVKQGFTGPIYCTHATRDLCNHMLSDSAYIQERDAEYVNKKRKEGEEMVEPLYTLEDAKLAMNQFSSIGYDRCFVVEKGVVGCFYDSGHILGSTLIHLVIHEKETDKRCTLAFTGDLGRKNLAILKDPQILPKTDYLITESTYGDRFHEAVYDASEKLIEIVNKTAGRGGKLIIPAFAVERTQEIVYHLNSAWRKKLIPDIPVFVDSPLSGNVTEVFSAHPECFDEETSEEFLKHRLNPFGFGRLKYISDVEDSKKLNSLNGPAIIISASGMCEFGRILHHLKNNIEDPKTSVLMVGYQAAHTLGRKLLEGEKRVKIFGELYDVNAEVHVIDAFSAHADRSDLLDYIGKVEGLKKIFLVHGEENGGLKFADVLRENGYKDVSVPEPGEEFDLC